MFEYFRGWRRKVGLVTLVMACVFAAGWARSLMVSDMLTVMTGEHSFEELKLGNHVIAWESLFNDLDSSNRPFVWNVYSPSDELDDAVIWNSQYYGFGFEQIGRTDDTFVFIRRIIPYWSIVIPLTLLSAWLLLSKRRQPTKPESSRKLEA